MAKLSDLKPVYYLFMRAYPYRRIDWRPASALSRPLDECRIAIVTTAAFYRPDQAPFDEKIRGGDTSYRELAVSTDLATLGIAHKSDAFDSAGLEQDKNLALPLDRLRELAEARVIGGPAPAHYSFMGSISAPKHLMEVTAPEVAARLKADDVDAVLLTPA